MAAKALQPYVAKFDELYRYLSEMAAAYRDDLSLTIIEPDESTRTQRVAMYALARAARIKITDKDGTLPPVLPAGLLKAARKHVYRVDPRRRPPSRSKMTLVLTAKLVLAGLVSAPLFLAWLTLGCWLWGFHVFWSTVGHLTSETATYPFRHPYQSHVFGVFVFALFIPGIWIFRIIDWWERHHGYEVVQTYQGGFGSAAIRNFRENSAYGDAQLAERHEIQRALRGHAVSDAPKFES